MCVPCSSRVGDDCDEDDGEYDVYTEAFARTEVAAKVIVSSEILSLAFVELFELTGAKTGSLFLFVPAGVKQSPLSSPGFSGIDNV